MVNISANYGDTQTLDVSEAEERKEKLRDSHVLMIFGNISRSRKLCAAAIFAD